MNQTSPIRTLQDKLDSVPNLVDYLRVGGPVWQSDGERIDGYARVFRWVQNRVFLPAGDDPGPRELPALLRGLGAREARWIEEGAR